MFIKPKKKKKKKKTKYMSKQNKSMQFDINVLEVLKILSVKIVNNQVHINPEYVATNVV